MSTTTIPWRKRSIDSDSPSENKRPRTNCWYFVLESESPADSEDDTESIDSVQGKETDVVKDTSDTETKSSEYEVEIEYDIASLSGSDRDDIIFGSGSSSDSEDMMLAAAVVCDSSLETFITDAEDSDNSRQDDSSTGLTDFWTCIQCKAQNDNPQFQFCDKCFQDRKTFFPPRPRRHKKAKRSQDKNAHSPVKLDALQSCLSGLSQDSGIGSSQEFPTLCLDQIVVPQPLNSDPAKPSTSVVEDDGKNRKRQISESSLSEDYEVHRPKKQKTTKKEENKENSVVVSEESKSDKRTTKEEEIKENSVVVSEESNSDKRTKTEETEVIGPLPECKEICIMCNVNAKNSVFLHGRIGHMCCCYKCAMRTWKSLKRCPICNRKVSNVVRVFTT